jgi:branched-chain amino acid transport system substrate-binding protein
MAAAGLTPDGLSQGGYLAAKMFVDALMPLKPEDITRETVTAAIQKVQSFKSDMLCETWAYGPADAKGRIGNRSGLIAEIKDGAWSVPDKCVTLTDAEIGK